MYEVSIYLIKPDRTRTMTHATPRADGNSNLFFQRSNDLHILKVSGDLSRNISTFRNNSASKTWPLKSDEYGLYKLKVSNSSVKGKIKQDVKVKQYETGYLSKS